MSLTTACVTDRQVRAARNRPRAPRCARGRGPLRSSPPCNDLLGAPIRASSGGADQVEAHLRGPGASWPIFASFGADREPAVSAGPATPRYRGRGVRGRRGRRPTVPPTTGSWSSGCRRRSPSSPSRLAVVAVPATGSEHGLRQGERVGRRPAARGDLVQPGCWLGLVVPDPQEPCPAIPPLLVPEHRAPRGAEYRVHGG